jgi:DNA modification methylase
MSVNVEFVKKAILDLSRIPLSLCQVLSAENNKISANTVDYIFTDPPFGANIMYSELSFLWESWLKIKTNNKEEAIENSSQYKTLFDYQEIMQRCFAEYYRILKPGKWMTVEFSNTGAAVWNGIQTSIQKAGFVIANVAALDKQQGSFKAVTSPTAVKQDLVISCYKPSSEFDEKFKVQSADVNIWTFIEEHLEHLPVSIIKDKATTAVIERSPKILYDRMLTFFLMRNLRIPLDAGEFQEGLRARFKMEDGMTFTATQLAEYQTQKKKLGIETNQLKLSFDIIYTENDAVQWIKDKLETEHLKYNELMPAFRKANTATRKGEKEFELKTILEENFIELADGSWRTPDPKEAKDRELLRTKALLKEFDHYLADIGSGKTKKLKDVRLEALRAGFKNSWEKKDWGTIVNIADKIPQNLLMEDEQLLMYYDIAKDRM